MQEKLHEAVKAKLTEQRRFVLWWDAQDLNALGNTTLADRQQYPDNSTIHRWRRRLKAPDKFAKALEAAHERCVKVCEARQGRTTAYRTNAGPDSQLDAHSATVVGD